MRWFHPIGGPVLFLPRTIVRRWRGQRRSTGFTQAYEAVVDGLGSRPWVALDIGGLALSDQGPIGVLLDDDAVRLVLQRTAPSASVVERVAPSAEVGLERNQLPWPSGEGVLFDAIEAGGRLDGGLTEPVTLPLPDGEVFLRTAEVHEGALHLVILELSGE